MLNMNGSSDPHYRYTMHCMQVRAEGRGGNKKTVLCNIDAVARDIGRPTNYLVQFLGYAKQTSTHVDAQGNWSLRGHHRAEDLQRAAFTFISDYVTCRSRKCSVPETSVVVEGGRRKSVVLVCRGCGHSSAPLPDADRIVRFMCSNPMPSLPLHLTASPRTTVPRDSVTQPLQPHVTPAAALTLGEGSDGDEEEEEWAVDVSDEAVAQRACFNQVRSIARHACVFCQHMPLLYRASQRCVCFLTPPAARQRNHREHTRQGGCSLGGGH